VLKNDSKLADEVLPYYANGRLPSKVGGESEVARETSSFSITGFQKKLEEV
jgi:hypothetical protein